MNEPSPHALCATALRLRSSASSRFTLFRYSSCLFFGPAGPYVHPHPTPRPQPLASEPPAEVRVARSDRSEFFQQRRWRAAERRHPTGRERTGSPTLQTHQDPILLLPWLCFRGGGFPTRFGGSSGAVRRTINKLSHFSHERRRAGSGHGWCTRVRQPAHLVLRPHLSRAYYQAATPRTPACG
jgi:hypothetical protein